MRMKPLPALLPFSWIYGAGVWLRNALFDYGVLRTQSLPVPVISVGNISAGGTGKTPFVEFLALELRRRGRKVGIVSRGFGRDSTGYQVVSNGHQRCAEAVTAGDEPALLANHLEDVPIVVDENRFRGAVTMHRAFGVDVVLLDDGFQHRRLGRNSDIVLLTAEELMQGSKLLPAGYRREPWSSLRRATLAVISKCSDGKVFEAARSRLPGEAPAFIVGIRTVVSGVVRFKTQETVDPSFLNGKTVVAFSGLGDPDAFDRTLSDLKARVEVHHRFPDHHWFTRQDLEVIARTMKETGAELLVSTEKDAVRLDRLTIEEGDILKGLPFYLVQIRAEVIAGNDVLAASLDAAFH